MSEYNVRAGDNDSSYGTFSTLEAAERALRMVQRLDPEARIVVKYDWQARALMAEAALRRVREAVERHERIYAPSDAEGIPVQVILRALDGDGDE